MATPFDPLATPQNLLGKTTVPAPIPALVSPFSATSSTKVVSSSAGALDAQNKVKTDAQKLHDAITNASTVMGGSSQQPSASSGIDTSGTPETNPHYGLMGPAPAAGGSTGATGDAGGAKLPAPDLTPKPTDVNGAITYWQIPGGANVQIQPGDTPPTGATQTDVNGKSITDASSINKTASDLGNIDYTQTQEYKDNQAKIDAANAALGIFSPQQQAQIDQAGTTAGSAYDASIIDAEKSKYYGMPEAVQAGLRAGGGMNTQITGTSAAPGQEGQAQGSVIGRGGELEKISSAYDFNIQMLEASKNSAIQQAKLAAQTAIQTGKQADKQAAIDAFDKANSLYMQQQGLITSRTTALANLQQKQMVKLTPGETYYDPQTGQMTTAPYKPDAPKFFTDSSGQVTRYDPSTGQQTSLGDLGKTGTTISQSDITSLADGVMSGSIPPDLKGLYKYGGPVRAELARRGFDLTTASNDYLSTQKFITSSNSTQQIRMKQAEASVENSLGNLEQLNQDYERSGFKFVNKADLIAATNGVLGPEAAKKAQALLGQIALVTDELGQTFMGGNSPTDAAFGLAANVLQGDFSKDTLSSQINLIKENLQFRKNSWAQVGPTSTGGGTNQYAQPNSQSSGDGLNVDWSNLNTSDF